MAKPPKRPDPGLYSQPLDLSGTGSATWDSPDITTNLGGGIDDFVVVSVRNYSTDAPSVSTSVRVEIAEFGIGFESQSLGSHTTNLARAGVAGSEADISFFVPPSVRQERDVVAVTATVSHPHDRDALNNVGHQAWSASPAQIGSDLNFAFRVRNRFSQQASFALQIVEADLPATLSSAAVTLLPGQTTSVVLRVAGNATETGSQRFSIAAFQPNGALYGGVFHRFDIGN